MLQSRRVWLSLTDRAQTGVRGHKARARWREHLIQGEIRDHTRDNVTKAHSKGDASASERISRYIAERADWRGKTLARLRKIFHDADPAIIEEWKWMGSPVWSHTGVVAVANAHRDKVKLTFSQGANLRDPHRLFNAGLGGNRWRAIDFYKDDEINETALKNLIGSAVRYNVSRRK